MINTNYFINEYQSESLLKCIFECYNDIGEYSYITEKTRKSFVERIKSFFRDLIMQIQNLIRDIKNKFLSEKRKKEFKKLLKEYHNTASLNNRYKIRKKIEMVDLWTYKDTYIAMNRDLADCAKRISKVDYKHLSEIDDDLNYFNGIVDEYSKKIEGILRRRISVDNERAIRFCEDELTGRSEVVKILEKNMDLFKEIESNALLLEKRADKYGVDILPKQMNLIRKICITISNKVNAAIVKFFTLLVLIF